MPEGYSNYYYDFIQALERRGWSAVTTPVEYKKGDWLIVFDTSSWMELGTLGQPRFKDLEVPRAPGDFQTTIDHIECLFTEFDQSAG